MPPTTLDCGKVGLSEQLSNHTVVVGLMSEGHVEKRWGRRAADRPGDVTLGVCMLS